MTDDPPSTDGGETTPSLDVERAGAAPPAPPTDERLDRLLPDLVEDVDAVESGYLVRAALADGSDRSVGERLVTALQEEVTVVASTLSAGFDPSNPELDVLVETDHDHGSVAASLANVGPVEGVVVADVTAAVERALNDAAAADAADANDVFNELKDEVRQEGYGDVVDELEDVSFPGGPDPDEEIDLEEEVGVELQEDDPEPIDLDDDDETLDLGGGDGAAGDIEMRDLLGEGDDDGSTTPPDQQAIEEAIESVELESEEAAGEAGRTDGEDAAAGGADADDADESGSTAADDDASPDGAGTGSAAVEPGPAPDGDVASGAGGDAPRSGGVPGDMDAFVAELVAALESGRVDEDRREELREALGIENTHSLDVRLEYLQKRVDNLAAYTDAWEEFLSEQGAGREFMETVREDLTAIEERLDAVESGGSGAAGERLDEVEDRIDDLESTFDDRVGALEEGIEAVQAKLKELLQWREHIGDVLDDREGR